MIINAMNATFFTGSRFDLTRMKISAFKLRLMFAIARNGQLPRFLSILNINTNSPQVSVTLHVSDGVDDVTLKNIEYTFISIELISDSNNDTSPIV